MHNRNLEMLVSHQMLTYIIHNNDIIVYLLYFVRASWGVKVSLELTVLQSENPRS